MVDRLGFSAVVDRQHGALSPMLGGFLQPVVNRGEDFHALSFGPCVFENCRFGQFLIDPLLGQPSVAHPQEQFPPAICLHLKNPAGEGVEEFVVVDQCAPFGCDEGFRDGVVPLHTVAAKTLSLLLSQRQGGFHEVPSDVAPFPPSEVFHHLCRQHAAARAALYDMKLFPISPGGFASQPVRDGWSQLRRLLWHGREVAVDADAVNVSRVIAILRMI